MIVCVTGTQHFANNDAGITTIAEISAILTMTNNIRAFRQEVAAWYISQGAVITKSWRVLTKTSSERREATQFVDCCSF